MAVDRALMRFQFQELRARFDGILPPLITGRSRPETSVQSFTVPPRLGASCTASIRNPKREWNEFECELKIREPWFLGALRAPSGYKMAAKNCGSVDLALNLRPVFSSRSAPTAARHARPDDFVQVRRAEHCRFLPFRAMKTVLSLFAVIFSFGLASAATIRERAIEVPICPLPDFPFWRC